MRPERWRQVEELYHAASEREPGDRGAFLQQACQGDHELKSEVESLLRQETCGEGLLGWATPAGWSAAESWATPPADMRLLGLDAAAGLSKEPALGLNPGDELGPYKIVDAIGSGGMGEVYRALDTQLERKVAIKVLPRALANDPERLARFEREAKVLAALNHPNIAVIYGLAEARGQRALVMELVAGETLARVIQKRRAMPFGSAAPVARQIAEALEAAHEKGIVHRDLKPGNVMVTPSGLVKVLDFGLAAMVQEESPAADDVTGSHALTMGKTLAGTILGTAAYISPEQASGLPVDKRSDIWSYGAVLWEMLTGKRLFEGGKTLSQTLDAVLHAEIDFGRLSGTVPEGIVELLRRCLDRDVTTRLRSIGEAQVAIARCVADPTNGARAVRQPARATKLAWALATLGIVAAVVLGSLYWRKPAPEERVVQTTILPPEKTTLAFTTNYGPPALSPDGRRMVFAATGEDGKSKLWIRPLDAAMAQPLEGTGGGAFPFWAPDSRWLGFFADAKLKKIDTQGGPPIPLADATVGEGGSWSKNGIIVFAPIGPSALLRVSSDGGNATAATALNASLGSYHRFPWFLPDGDHFLFAAQKGSSGGRMNLLVASLSSTAAKIIGEADSNAVYAEGRLLYLRGSALVAQSFDLRSLQAVGEPVQVAERVVRNVLPYSAGVFSVSATGLLAYQGGFSAPDTLQLTWFDRTGKPLGTIGQPQTRFGALELSPDRKTLVASVPDDVGNIGLWVHDSLRGLPMRFTFDPSRDINAVWSPDGRTIVFNSDRKGRYDLYRKPANGSGAEELLYADDQAKLPSSWSPDGKVLLYHTFSGSQGVHLWVLAMTPEANRAARPRRLLQTSSSDLFGQFSPDGQWIVYGSNETQDYEIYAAPFLRPSEKRQISTSGGIRPRWSRNGKEIFYHTRAGQLLAAEVRISGETVEVGPVRELFRGIPALYGYAWDISADGQRILAAVPVKNQKAPEPITLVQNWAAGLKK